jgi:hypothetical protein
MPSNEVAGASVLINPWSSSSFSSTGSESPRKGVSTSSVPPFTRHAVTTAISRSETSCILATPKPPLRTVSISDALKQGSSMTDSTASVKHCSSARQRPSPAHRFPLCVLSWLHAGHSVAGYCKPSNQRARSTIATSSPCTVSDKSPAKVISCKEVMRIDSGWQAHQCLVGQKNAGATRGHDDRGPGWRPQAAGC